MSSTYGKGDAAPILELILKQQANPKLSKRVGALYSDYCTGLRHIERIADKTYRNRSALLWRNEFKKIVYDTKYFSIELRDHLLNVLSVRYRETIRR